MDLTNEQLKEMLLQSYKSIGDLNTVLGRQQDIIDSLTNQIMILKQEISNKE
jgi:hypothetical protein